MTGSTPIGGSDPSAGSGPDPSADPGAGAASMTGAAPIHGTGPAGGAAPAAATVPAPGPGSASGPSSALRGVLITGGASGIGLETARVMRELGAEPHLLDRDAEALGEAAEALGLPEERLHAADVTDADAVEAAVGRIGADLAGLVACAGVALDRPALDTDAATFRRILDVNLTGAFVTACACARLWRRRRRPGAIVLVSSISGMCGNKGRAAYGASKGGLNALTMTLANEWGPLGIRVNAVAPGPVDTPMARRVHTADVRRQWHERVALARYGTTREVAAAIAFLSSEGAAYVTGQILAVDGGFLATGLRDEPA